MSNRPIGKYVFLWLSIGIFLAAVIYKHFFVSVKNTPTENARQISIKLENELNEIEGSLVEIKSILLDSAQNASFSRLLLDTQVPYFVFSNKHVIFWSNNLYTPKYGDVLGDFNISYIETTRGKYLVRKEQFIHKDKSFDVVFLIPLVENSKVVNEYLKNTHNENIFTDSNFEISPIVEDQNEQIIEIYSKGYFSIKFGNTYSNSNQNSRGIIILLIVFSFLFIGVFVFKQLMEYIRERNIGLGFLFLLSCILILRSLMLLINFPFDFVYIDLFDPRHYASSLVNPSLGDLLLNLISLLILGYYLLNSYLHSFVIKKILNGGKRTQFIAASCAIFFSFFWLAVHHQTMKTLNFDSQWSMDVTQNLEFDYLKLIGLGIFLISVVVYFQFAHVCFRIFIQMVRTDKKKYFSALISGLVLFFLFALVLRWDYEVVIVVNFIFIMTVSFFNLPKFIGKIQYLTFIYFFSFGIPGSIIGLYANFQYTRSSTDYNKSRLANQLLIESNFFTEMQLAEISEKIKDDIFIQSRINSPYGSKLIIEKKIRSVYLNNLDKFDIQVYAFNSRGEPFAQFNIRDNYHEFRSRLDEFRTETEGLYFINQARGQAAIRYVNFVEIEERGRVTGYILLDLTQKRFVPNSVFPLLLNKNQYAQQLSGTELFSYGVFDQGELQYNYGPFNYRKSISEFSDNSDKLFEKNVQILGFNHKAFKGDGKKFVIVSSNVPTLSARISNFSFLFLIYVFSILIILIFVTFFLSLKHIKLNYATKIQLYLNFAFFTPLIIVSVTTVSIIVQTFKSSLENQYLEYAENLSAEISKPLSEFRRGSIEKEDLSEEVHQIAQIADLDVNVFRNNGRLVASSLFQIYQNEILSQNINPSAFSKIMEELESPFVLEEQVGLLKYKNVYVGIRSYDTGAIIGILSLPFFASQKDLERNIVEVLSNILNIFTFVFIIFLFVSFFVSRGLTFPLRLITQKIKRTTLSSFNEPLSWNSDDEIGLMVTEYNRMLLNLEDNKKVLAKSEKESAWREMAKQVAHEIKNPLTPMKLTLQHMKRVIDQDAHEKDEDKKLKQIDALLEQIEILSDIATSFSDFAKMPEPQSEKLDLALLLKETIDLYNKKELGQIVTNLEQGQFMIEGDRKWLGRSLSNMIINGFQAINDHTKAKIEVKLFSKEGNVVRIEIKDNGNGIPENIRSKVFTPNFSTKYTGSGLGLAITKKGIEHANGKIWFSSEEGVGTIFYVEIPSA